MSDCVSHHIYDLCYVTRHCMVVSCLYCCRIWNVVCANTGQQ